MSGGSSPGADAESAPSPCLEFARPPDRRKSSCAVVPGRRPGLELAPAVVEDVGPDRRLGRRAALEVALEPGEVRVVDRREPEVGRLGAPHRRERLVREGPDHQPLLRRPERAQSGVVVDRAAQEAVVPAGEVQRRDRDALVRRIHAPALPVLVVGGMREPVGPVRGHRLDGHRVERQRPVVVGDPEHRRAQLAQRVVVAPAARRVVGEEERPGQRPAEEQRAVRVDPAVVGLGGREAGADRGEARRLRHRRQQLDEPRYE